MRWYEGFWAIYKGIEVQKVCLETLNQRKQIVIQKNPYSLMRKALKHESKKQKVPIFLFLSCGLRVFQFSFQRMHNMAEPHALPHEVSAFIYTSC